MRHARHRPSRSWSGEVSASSLSSLWSSSPSTFCPPARLLLAALAPGGVFDPERRSRALAEPLGRPRRAGPRLETAFLSSLLALLLGSAMALALGVTDVRGRRIASFLFVLSMMISPQVVALAFLHLAGPASPILNTLGLAPAAGSANPMLGRGGIVLVLGLHHAPLVYVVMSAGLKRIPSAVVEAARIDGAQPLRIVTDHLLPLLRPHLVGARCSPSSPASAISAFRRCSACR